MSRAVMTAVTVGLMAMLLSACGIAAKPLIGTKHPSKIAGYTGHFDDPRTTHLKCLKALRPKLKYYAYWTPRNHLAAIQIGKPNVGPTMIFYPTPGQPQALQQRGEDEGAEAINNVMLYPNKGSSKLLAKAWACAEISN